MLNYSLRHLTKLVVAFVHKVHCIQLTTFSITGNKIEIAYVVLD